MDSTKIIGTGLSDIVAGYICGNDEGEAIWTAVRTSLVLGPPSHIEGCGRNCLMFGFNVAHDYRAIFSFELLFEGCRRSGSPIRHFVELGTASGGLSLYLALLCFQYGASFLTFDIEKPAIFQSRIGILFEGIGLEAKSGDIFNEKSIEQIRKMLDVPECLFLYCDNGDKVREIKTYADSLKEGDILGCHNWNWEYEGEGIGNWLREHGFTLIGVSPYLQAFWKKTNCGNKRFGNSKPATLISQPQRKRIHRGRKAMKLVAMMLTHNDEDRYLEPVLERLTSYVDEIVILDDSDDNSAEIAKGYKNTIVHKIEPSPFLVRGENVIRRQLYNLTIERNPDWILAICSDYIFQKKFEEQVRAMLETDYRWFQFSVCDMWDKTHFIMPPFINHGTKYLFRFERDKSRSFLPMKLHCGDVPSYLLADPNGLKTDILIKHLGYIQKEDRLRRIAMNEEFANTPGNSAVLPLVEQLRVLDETPRDPATLGEWKE